MSLCARIQALIHSGLASEQRLSQIQKNVVSNFSKPSADTLQLPAISEIRSGFNIRSSCLPFLPRNGTMREEAAYLTKLLCSLLIVIIQGKCFEVKA